MPGHRHRRQHRRRQNELSSNVLRPRRNRAQSAGRAGTIDPMADQTNSRIRQTQVGITGRRGVGLPGDERLRMRLEWDSLVNGEVLEFALVIIFRHVITPTQVLSFTLLLIR